MMAPCPRASRFLGVCAAAALALAGPAWAQPYDHLQCWKIRADHDVRGLVDLTPLAAGLPPSAGCRISGPRLYCSAVAKSNVRTVPPPVGAPDGPEPGDFLCYKTTCPGMPAPRTVSDQLGTFTITPRKSGIVCTPVASTTTTVVSTTTSTTAGPGCPGTAFATCGGTCPAGEVCQAVGLNSAETGVVTFCSCVPGDGVCGAGGGCTAGPCGPGLFCGAFFVNGTCQNGGCFPLP